MVDEGYAGPATLCAEGTDIGVRVRLSGQVEPLDGRYHWAGRIAPQAAVTQLYEAGVRSASLRIDGGEPVQVRLSDVDPWGAVRVTAASAPPWRRVGQ